MKKAIWLATKTLLWTLGLWTFGLQPAQANPEPFFDLNQLTYGGTGCPGSGDPIRVSYNDSKQRLLVLFPEMSFKLSAGRLQRRACSLALPVQVPAGKKLVIGSTAVFGKTDLPATEPSSLANIDVRGEAFFAGSSGPMVARSIDGGSNGYRYFYERIKEETVHACGQSATVRLNLSIMGRIDEEDVSGTAALDGVAMNLRLEDCI